MARTGGDARLAQEARRIESGQTGSGAGAGSLNLRAGQKLSDQELMQLLYSVGFRGDALLTAFAVAKAESSGNAGAHNPNAGTGDNSFGLFQINMLGDMGPERRRRWGLSSNEDLFDPLVNAKIAFDMSNGGKTWAPWSVHPDSKGRGGKGSGFQQHLSTARSTLSSLQAAGQLEGVEVSSGGSFGGGIQAADAGGGIQDADGNGIVDAADVKATIHREFGYMGWAIDHPELGPLLTRAAEEQWDEATLRGALTETEWWQQNDVASRTWEAVLAEDPAEAARTIEKNAASIDDLASKIGLDLDPERIRELAEATARFGWTSAELNDALTAELEYDPQGDPIMGTFGATMDQLRQTAGNFYLQFGDEALFGFAKQILAGQETLEGVEATMREQAIGRFPQLAGLIEKGTSPRQFFSSYQQEAARLLEVPPEQIDLLSDPKLRRVLDPVDAQDGSKTTMSLTQFGELVRNTPQWSATRGAQTQAARLGQSLIETFGKV